jgi:hypothetical protein
MVSNGENLQKTLRYLEEWRTNIKQRVREINEIARQKGISTYFSIGSISGVEAHLPYMTPVRLLEDGVLSGVIVFSQTQAIIAADTIKSEVDKVLVDVEKKIGIQLGYNDDLLAHFDIPVPSHKDRSRTNIEFGNISSAVRTVLASEQIIEYKPNDITVEAVWTFLSLRLQNLSGRRVGLIGCGNIGFKLALKLVESGVNVALYRRDANKGMFMANAINMIKPSTTIAMATYATTPLQASTFSDVLIGAANTGVTVINWSMIQTMSPNGFVIDLGKGNIEDRAIREALVNNIEIIRGDISAAIYGFISHTRQMLEILKSKVGKLTLESGVVLVSGGMFGLDGEVVVDDYLEPSMIYGVSDGAGNVKLELTIEDKNAVAAVEHYIANHPRWDQLPAV